MRRLKFSLSFLSIGLDILLYQGVWGNESLVACKRVPVRALVNQGKSGALNSRSALDQQGDVIMPPNELELSLDTTLGEQRCLCAEFVCFLDEHVKLVRVAK